MVRRVGRMVQTVLPERVGITAQVPIEPPEQAGTAPLGRPDLLATARSSIDLAHHMLGITPHAMDHR